MKILWLVSLFLAFAAVNCDHHSEVEQDNENENGEFRAVHKLERDVSALWKFVRELESKRTVNIYIHDGSKKEKATGNHVHVYHHKRSDNTLPQSTDELDQESTEANLPAAVEGMRTNDMQADSPVAATYGCCCLNHRRNGGIGGHILFRHLPGSEWVDVHYNIERTDRTSLGAVEVHHYMHAAGKTCNELRTAHSHHPAWAHLSGTSQRLKLSQEVDRQSFNLAQMFTHQCTMKVVSRDVSNCCTIRRSSQHVWTQLLRSRDATIQCNRGHHGTGHRPTHQHKHGHSGHH
ncbi:uncharacterized protein LOC141902707 [Tubulanus polymorphus]|uniref:uncharacterized protein LOC141902707 n=1 Tax=Tubulanus polymorphus TaxID=672921 RepID=UPI003DA4C9C9